MKSEGERGNKVDQLVRCQGREGWTLRFILTVISMLYLFRMANSMNI